MRVSYLIMFLCQKHMRVSLLFQFVCKKHMRVSNIPHLFKRCLHPTPFCSRSAANLVSSVGDVVTAVCTKRRGSRTLRKKRSHATAAGCFHCCAEKGAEHCHAVLLVVGFGMCRNRRRLLQNRTTLLRLLLARLLSCSLCGTGWCRFLLHRVLGRGVPSQSLHVIHLRQPWSFFQMLPYFLGQEEWKRAPILHVRTSWHTFKCHSHRSKENPATKAKKRLRDQKRTGCSKCRHAKPNFANSFISFFCLCYNKVITSIWLITSTWVMKLITQATPSYNLSYPYL